MSSNVCQHPQWSKHFFNFKNFFSFKSSICCCPYSAASSYATFIQFSCLAGLQHERGVHSLLEEGYWEDSQGWPIFDRKGSPCPCQRAVSAPDWNEFTQCNFMLLTCDVRIHVIVISNFCQRWWTAWSAVNISIISKLHPALSFRWMSSSIRYSSIKNMSASDRSRRRIKKADITRALEFQG